MANKKNVNKTLPKNQAHGSLASEKTVFEIMQLNDFPYKQRTTDEYKAYLDAMNLSEMQRHAIEVANILPNTLRRDRLESRLEQEFIKKTAAAREPQQPTSTLSKKDEEDIKKLLR